MWTDSNGRIWTDAQANEAWQGATAYVQALEAKINKQAAELEQLRVERNDLAADLERIACPWCGYVQAVEMLPHVCDRCERLISMRHMAERDDLAAKLAAAQTELDELRVRVGLGRDIPALVIRLLDEVGADSSARVTFMQRLREELSQVNPPDSSGTGR